MGASRNSKKQDIRALREPEMSENKVVIYLYKLSQPERLASLKAVRHRVNEMLKEENLAPVGVTFGRRQRSIICHFKQDSPREVITALAQRAIRDTTMQRRRSSKQRRNKVLVKRDYQLDYQQS